MVRPFVYQYAVSLVIYTVQVFHPVIACPFGNQYSGSVVVLSGVIIYEVVM